MDILLVQIFGPWVLCSIKCCLANILIQESTKKISFEKLKLSLLISHQWEFLTKLKILLRDAWLTIPRNVLHGTRYTPIL